MIECSLSIERIVQAANKALDALKKMKAERNASSHIERKRVKQEMSNLLKDAIKESRKAKFKPANPLMVSICSKPPL
jgi:hypothetical protein